MDGAAGVRGTATFAGDGVEIVTGGATHRPVVWSQRAHILATVDAQQ